MRKHRCVLKKIFLSKKGGEGVKGRIVRQVLTASEPDGRMDSKEYEDQLGYAGTEKQL